MSPFREKTQIFLLGLMLGLLIGGSFFVFKLDDYFRELNFYKRMQDSEQSGSSIGDEKKDDKLTNSRHKNKGGTALKPSGPAKDSSFAYTELSPDSSLFQGDTDSLTQPVYITGEDGLVIRRDELLAVRNFDVLNLDLPASKAIRRDSILEEMSGIRENIPAKDLTVEYWKSPINYRGYKMSRSKLVLYGFDSGEPLRIFRLEETIYVRHSASTYRMSFTDNFRQLEKETDALVLAKLSR